MDEMKELSMEEMENTAGGTERMVNTGIEGLDAALRAEPRKSSRQIGHMPNYTWINTVSDRLFYDPESGRNFVEVIFNGKRGWVAASIVGLKR